MTACCSILYHREDFPSIIFIYYLTYQVIECLVVVVVVGLNLIYHDLYWVRWVYDLT